MKSFPLEEIRTIRQRFIYKGTNAQGVNGVWETTRSCRDLRPTAIGLLLLPPSHDQRGGRRTHQEKSERRRLLGEEQGFPLRA